MHQGKRILAIIPARAGSKGLPRKNIRPLCEKPLIVWTIEAAQKSRYVDEIHVSTDGEEIAEIARSCGVKIDALRPSHLAQDTSGSVELVEHILQEYRQKNQHFDIIILLEPTSPLRKENDIDAAIELMLKNYNSDGVVSVGEVHLEHPSIVKKIDEAGNLASYFEVQKAAARRQDLDKAYFPYGVLYLIKASVFEQKKSFYTDKILPYQIERWQNYEIDDLCDFVCVEAILKEKIVQKL